MHVDEVSLDDIRGTMNQAPKKTKITHRTIRLNSYHIQRAVFTQNRLTHQRVIHYARRSRFSYNMIFNTHPPIIYFFSLGEVNSCNRNVHTVNEYINFIQDVSLYNQLYTILPS